MATLLDTKQYHKNGVLMGSVVPGKTVRQPMTLSHCAILSASADGLRASLIIIDPFFGSCRKLLFFWV
jgi:hypothetical protein